MKISLKKQAKFWAEVFDLLVFLILVFWIVLFIRLFIATPYTVIWSSMVPNFYQKDWIIVEKITQRFSTFQRWDVIVFVASWKTSPYIKRIIWLCNIFSIYNIKFFYVIVISSTLINIQIFIYIKIFHFYKHS